MKETPNEPLTRINPFRPQMWLWCLVMMMFPFFAACKSGSTDGAAGGKDPEDVHSFASLKTLQSPSRNYQQPKADSLFLVEYIKKEKEFSHHLPLMETFYQDRDYELAWFEQNQLLPQAEKLMQAIDRAHKEGLDPHDYQGKDLRAMYQDFDRMPLSEGRKQQKQQELDFSLTASYFNYASDFYKGAIDPHSTAAIEWQVKRNKVKLNKALETILRERDSSHPFYEFEAFHEGYIKLREALVQYRKLQEQGGWPKVEAEGLVQLNDTAEVVFALRKRLLPEQRVDERDSAFYIFDQKLEQAVIRFQRQHGLEVDGIVGPATYQALNVSVDERIDQIVLNMERWRWLPKRLVPEGKPNRYVLVNIPAFKVYVMEDGKEALRMRAVVGETMHTTPVFSHQIQYLVFAPYWNVPNSIVERDIKPRLQKNRNWLSTQNMELVTEFGNNARRVPVSRVNWNTMTRENFQYRVRQKPGPKNSLGKVKFMFPNEYAVYLHDTPYDQLFNEADRDFSNGCVRVEKPLELAEFLLQDTPGWDRNRIRRAMNGSEELYVNLQEEVPVYLVYFTTWVEDDGTVHFRDDIYGHDKALAQEFF
jgi:L,D-transpeptidase YcbB